ncbi:HlyD family efflux transporter periplasmic adaptor subunit [Corynebacterium silvaticum]|uniref:HlyD family efflux transporter periplasmic adaptor subunit n=1 Tax=Corynebacterium silvaticum TaxID=2320431 RepID=A0A7U5QQ83_9CORY|nr:HlyD family efflux transporter periplasmic adaptor subunit [Corynebacterium silvaticum]ARU46850.1 HlyD family efflux transporter periplasmic adaptor subunit [Corynebacterium silvaticum]UWH00096.1 HlyD family efflux transporter periplasmic adaptor subunit [Corynebacterium silvaticum]UWH02142.1 HlyD family efflux transporter periplasmic adaptor subunit [Corynebacterium silvaticum]UWH04181.1 HlyD family efflux transporter periplasmic adaptor subunit [Corynebacterium silvaticum]UXZ26342.1 HlyD 
MPAAVASRAWTTLKKKKVFIPLLSVLALVGVGAYFVAPKEQGEVIPVTEYTQLESAEVANRVLVEGTVEPIRAATLYTHLTGPVASISTKVGDKVSTDQLLAKIDTLTAKTELATQRATAAQSLNQAMAQAETAQQQYDQLKSRLDQGLNTEINSANAQKRQANEEYIKAQQAFERKAWDRQHANTPELRSQDAAVKQARDQLFSAALDAARTGAVTAFGIARSSQDNDDSSQDKARLEELKAERDKAQDDKKSELDSQISALESQMQNRNQSPSGTGQSVVESVIGSADSLVKLNGAQRQLTEAERNYIATLATVDRELSDSQRGVANAFESHKEAATNAAAAEFAVQQQLAQHELAINQAWRGANTAQDSSALTLNKLQLDINSSDVRVPFSGVVMAVPAQQGKPAAGEGLVTIGDDSSLIVNANVKEADVAKLRVNDKVSLTSTSSGTKTFEGRIKKIVNVAKLPAANAENASKAKPLYPVEIELTGNRDGLLIGGTVKARVNIDKNRETIKLPAEAVYQDGNTKKVLVLADKDGASVVEARTVTVGSTNDIIAEITGGELKPGDKVLNQASKYKDMIGTSVSMQQNAIVEGN